MIDWPVVMDQMVTNEGAFRFDRDNLGKLGRQLVIQPWEDSLRLDQLFDPREYLRKPFGTSMGMEGNIRYLYGILKGEVPHPHVVVPAVKRTGSTVTVTQGPPSRETRYVFDLDQGGNLKSYEQPGGNGSSGTSVRLTYEQHEGVWFPATYESVTTSPADPAGKANAQKDRVPGHNHQRSHSSIRVHSGGNGLA